MRVAIRNPHFFFTSLTLIRCEKGEEIVGYFKTYLNISSLRQDAGLLVLTNKRFLFVQRPSGLFSKGFDVLYSLEWNDITSVSTSGFLLKRVNVTMRIKDAIKKLQFDCDNVEQIKYIARKGQFSFGVADQIAEKIAMCKKNYLEPTTIQATKVVIEEANKDKENAIVILQKRLAKGEITLEEFHKLVTRL